MVPALLLLLGGLILLAWSADRLMAAASSLAHTLGMPPLLLGLLVIGFGTSAPELLISLVAALDGQPEIAIGNALGSNIANVGLILGLTLVIFPLPADGARRHLGLALLAVATVLGVALLLDRTLDRLDGALLLGAMAVALLLLAFSGRFGAAAPLLEPDDPPPALGRARAAAELAVMLAVVVISARILVLGAVDLARAAGISELAVGLGVVAIGTSLPELATGLAAARRGAQGLLYGNLIGSNLFNVLGVTGLAAVVHPMGLEPALLQRDVPALALFTLALIAMGLGRLPGRRGVGAALLVAYTLYLGALVAGG